MKAIDESAITITREYSKKLALQRKAKAIAEEKARKEAAAKEAAEKALAAQQALKKAQQEQEARKKEAAKAKKAAEKAAKEKAAEETRLADEEAQKSMVALEEAEAVTEQRREEREEAFTFANTSSEDVSAAHAKAKENNRELQSAQLSFQHAVEVSPKKQV